MKEILIILAIPLLISFLLTLILARKMTIVSCNGYSTLRHKGDVSKSMEMGGLSLFPIMLISMCVTLALPYTLNIMGLRQHIEPATMRVMQVIVGCAFLYIMGIKDDFHGVYTKTKLSALFIVAAMFPASGLWLNDLHGLFGIHALSPWIGMPLTLLIAVFLTQLPSITDSPDGRATGTCTLLVALFLLLGIYCRHALSTIIASAALGVVLPFSLCKRFSKKWEKTLMGSSGNYILGYILSYLSIGLTRQCGDRLPGEAFMVCVAISLVPMLDALRVLKSRVADRRDLLTPDRNQMQHLFMRTGMPLRLVSPATFAVILTFVLLNLLLVRLQMNPTTILVIDLAAWIGVRLLINWLINRHETRFAHRKWNKVYGREAWEANVPIETLNKKVEVFGTMGLPLDMVSNNTTEFIPDGMSGFERNTKRFFDLLISGLCLIVFSPLFLACYVIIKLDDHGPAIYKQERLGRFGRPFLIYKFRSMRIDAEQAGPALSHAGGDYDPRLTRAGRFLRAHHLDELPQLWNVFTGDMAFVGYRPERKFFIDQIMSHDPRYAFLYQIRPGVTSYATLHYGYTDTMEKMLRRTELDLYYLKNRSWLFDIKVLFHTFMGIISGKKF